MKARLMAIAVLTVMLAAACADGVVYDRYRDTAVSGWGRADSLHFYVPPADTSGVYDMTLGVRITGAFPFMGMTLVVQTTVSPEGRTLCDTIDCPLVAASGQPLGEGVSVFETSHLVRRLTLQKGDSLHISVRHDMRRTDLPGVTGIGIRMRRDG